MKYFLITAFGEDKPGIVKAVTEVLYRHNFNIEDSTMTRINNEFTIMLVVQTDNDTTEEILKKELKRIEEELRLTVNVKEIPEEVVKGKRTVGETYSLIVYGADKPGIVYKVAKLLADKNINISDLRTEKTNDLYVMIIEAEFPKGINIEDFEKELDKLKKEINVDVSFEKIESAEM